MTPERKELEQQIVRVMLERGAVLMKAIGYPFYVEGVAGLERSGGR